MQINGNSSQINQQLLQLNKLNSQILDKIQNFNQKVLKVAVTDRVESQIHANKTKAAIDFLA